MPEIASLVLEVTEKGVVLTTDHLKQLAAAGKSAETSFGDVAKRIAGYTTAADLAVRAGQAVLRGIKDLAVESVVLAASFEKSRMTWGVLVGDMDKGAKVFQEIMDFAAKTPLSFEGLNQAATTLKGFGVEADNLIPTLSQLGDIAMGDNQKLSQLALVYGQVMAQGKAKTQDLYQFINAGVPIFNMLAESMGKATGEIKDLTAAGAITFEEIEAAIQKATTAGGDFYGLMDKTADTVAGKWSTAQDNFKQQLAELGETLLPAVTAALNAANTEMERWNRLRESREKVVRDVSLTNLVSGGDVSGVAAFLGGLTEEVTRSQVQAWITAARLANPMATRAQSLALQQAQAMLELFPRTLAAPASAPGVAAPPVAPPAGSGGGGSTGSSRQVGGPLQGEKNVFDEAERSVQGYGDAARVAAANTNTLSEAFMEQQRQAEAFARSMDAIQTAFDDAGKAAFIETFQSLGEALVSGADAGETLAESLAGVGKQLLNALPMLLLNAGLQAMVMGQWQVGLGLIAASGLVAVGSGVANELAEQNALGGVYSSPSLHAYANGVYNTPQHFAFRQGAAFGWEGMQAFARGGVFGEAGPEAIMPLRRTSSGALGVQASGGNVSIVINNNAPGTQATAQETRGPDGERQITVLVESIVKSAIGSGKMDGAMSRFGARPQGIRT